MMNIPIERDNRTSIRYVIEELQKLELLGFTSVYVYDESQGWASSIKSVEIDKVNDVIIKVN